MPNKLEGKKVVLIGGTSGIGFGVAEAAKAQGASVLVASSTKEKIDSAVARLGPGAAGAIIDAGSEPDVERFFREIGPFDHLVFTAGDWDRPADQWDLEASQWIFRIRFWGALRAIKHSRNTIARDGSITLTDGAAGRRPRRGQAISSAGAMAIENLVRGLAIELAPVRVNCVCPGLLISEATSAMPRELLQSRVASQPLPRPGTIEEVAEAYLYLMRGTYTTGDVLLVEGGYTLV